jgi:AcrR family transcriptional regulator
VEFSGSTRELAKRVGVTQALLYRHFPTKSSLIEAVYDELYVARWDADWVLAVCRSSNAAAPDVALI